MTGVQTCALPISTQQPGKRGGAHSETLDEEAFARFAEEVGDLELDCVVEVKDKERSALRAQGLLAAGVDTPPRPRSG